MHLLLLPMSGAWLLSPWLLSLSAPSSHHLLLCLIRVHVIAFRAHLDNPKSAPPLKILSHIFAIQNMEKILKALFCTIREYSQIPWIRA